MFAPPLRIGMPLPIPPLGIMKKSSYECLHKDL